MFPVSDYCLVIESDPGDNQSDLIGVRRVGGRMFEQARTCVDRIPRAGNSKGKILTTITYEGWPALADLDLDINPLEEWLVHYGKPIDLR